LFNDSIIKNHTYNSLQNKLLDSQITLSEYFDQKNELNEFQISNHEVNNSENKEIQEKKEIQENEEININEIQDNSEEKEKKIQKYKILKEYETILNFLQNDKTQLTYYGLSEILSILCESEVGVLFRNNHFSVICKYQSQLYVLINDIGYLDKEDVVWERINDIEGDNTLCKGDYTEYIYMDKEKENLEKQINAINIKSDYEVAAQLQKEEDIKTKKLIQQRKEKERKEIEKKNEEDSGCLIF
jgi:ubiquitin carboxyl-terminal hydrolase MINDY-1/2